MSISETIMTGLIIGIVSGVISPFIVAGIEKWHLRRARKKQICNLRKELIGFYEQFMDMKPISDESRQISAPALLEIHCKHMIFSLNNFLRHDVYALKIEERGQLRKALDNLDRGIKEFTDICSREKGIPFQPELKFYEEFFFEQLRKIEWLNFPARMSPTE